MSDGYVSVGKIDAFIVDGPPVDISGALQAVAPNAWPRMLSRFVDAANGTPALSVIASTCTHRGCPVLTGDGVWGSTDAPIFDALSHVVTCPCHGSQFNVQSGAVVRGPARTPLISFATEVRGDEVFVAIAAEPVNPAMRFNLHLDAEVSIAPTSSTFPGTGNKYLVDFGVFVVELFFENETTLTYTGIRRDGSRGSSETVAIQATYLRDDLFMVTWQESDRTTVVHLEDYEQSIIYTNITNPDQSFVKFRGTFKQIR
ncbi:Rieske (2Fe-2S) protein [Roseateles sp. P5_E1]